MTAYTTQTPDLEQIEVLVGAVSTALVDGDVQTLTSASAALRDAVASMAGVGRGNTAPLRIDPAMRQRMERLSMQMARQREGVRRRAVVVDRALSAVLPGEDDSTYADKLRADRKRANPARIYTALAT